MTEAGGLSLEICRPIEAHARRIMAWRNDPVSLVVSYHRAPKRWESFWPEYCAAYFREPSLPPFFLLAEGRRVAFLRYQPAPHPEGARGRTVDISVNVAPAERGRGFGRAAIEFGSAHLRAAAGVDCVLAEVRTENEASRRAFVAAGFRQIDEIEKLVPDTGEKCRIFRLLHDLTPAYWRGRGVRAIVAAPMRARSDASAIQPADAVIETAAQAKADAVKFETSAPMNGAPPLPDAAGANCETLAMAAQACRARGMEVVFALSSPAEAEAAASLVDAFAVDPGAGERDGLLRAAGRSGRPLLLGLSEDAGVEAEVAAFRAAGGRDLCLMRRRSSGAGARGQGGLRSILRFGARFAAAAGYCDDGGDLERASLAAVALGARVIETRVAPDCAAPLADSARARTPDEIARLIAGVRAMETLLCDDDRGDS